MTTRRKLLAASPAVVLAAAIPAASAAAPATHIALPLTSEEPDPLLVLVEQYRREWTIYNSGEKDPDDRSGWNDPFEILCSDPPAPTTLRGALEGIRLVVFETEQVGGGLDDMTVAVLQAVDRFFAAALAAA
jgi:hypothetical protein